jgi:ubiquinone/menaquinone biosynthesis C-methylase UbiE
MREGLKRLLKKFPRLYSFVEKIYSFGALKFRYLQERFLGTRLAEREWATRHLRRGSDWNDTKHAGDNDEWIRGYWDSRDHSHRQFLLEHITKFSPVSSILEIGCNCGPNLYLLARKFPNVEIVGIDINPAAIQKGNEWFTQEGIRNVKLLVGKADELEQFEDKRFDIVFTDAVLIYIGPDKIKEVIKGVLRIARKALILFEYHSFGCAADPRGVYVGHWMRDYAALLKEFVPQEIIHIAKMPEELWADKYWQKYGGVVEVDLENQSRKPEEVTHK